VKYKILEHPTRGIFVEFDDEERKPRFRWSILRTDPQAHAFYNEASIQRELARWPTKVRERTQVVDVDTTPRPFRMRVKP